MMLTVLRRLEDVLVQVVRVVLLAFALVVLLALALWVWDSWRGSKPSSPDGAQPAALNWKDARLDMDYVVSETGRDLGQAGNQVPLTQRLADAQLRPSFQKADQLIRAFVNQDPAARARVEKDNSSRGLAPVHPLLAGSGAPDAALVQRLHRIVEGQDVAVDDHRNLHGFLHLANERPVGAAIVELAARAAMHRHHGDAGGLGPAGEFRRIHRPLVPAEPHLQRHRNGARRDGRLDQRQRMV